METPKTVPEIIPIDKVKKPKKPCTEAQLTNLRTGMEALKKKRELIAKDKEERIKQNLPPPPPETRVKHVQNYAVEKPVKIRKERTVYTTPKVIKESIFSDSEYLQLKELLNKEKAPVKEVIKEVIQQKEVIKEVVKDRVVSGSSMLDAIFFGKR